MELPHLVMATIALFGLTLTTVSLLLQRLWKLQDDSSRELLACLSDLRSQVHRIELELQLVKARGEAHGG